MYSDCECVKCICKTIKESMEENYLLNRDAIIEKLYKYFSTYSEKSDPLILKGKLISETDDQKFDEYGEKLRNIQQMIENGDNETDILIELEILETSVKFLQKQSSKKIFTKLGLGAHEKFV